MRRDHEVQMNMALDQLYMQGSTTILWTHLYHWYNAERLSRTVFSDIIARWQSLCEGYGHSEDEIPELEEVKNDHSWLILRRGIFEHEKITPLADRT